MNDNNASGVPTPAPQAPYVQDAAGNWYYLASDGQYYPYQPEPMPTQHALGDPYAATQAYASSENTPLTSPSVQPYVQGMTSQAASSAGGKKRIGLIIGVLVTIVALVLAGIFLLPRLFGGSQLSAGDVVVPSDDWVNGKEKVWNLEASSFDFAAKDTYMVVSDLEGIRGYDISGTELKELWHNTSGASRIRNLMWQGDTLYALQWSERYERATSISIDPATGEIGEGLPLKRESDENPLVVFLVDSGYVQCEFDVPKTPGGPGIFMLRNRFPFHAPKYNEFFTYLEYCSGHSYSGSENWRLDAPDFPDHADLVTFDLVNGKAHEISHSPKSRWVDNIYGGFYQYVDEEVLVFPKVGDRPVLRGEKLEVMLMTVEGEELGTLTIETGSEVRGQVVMERLAHLSVDEAKALLDKESVDDEELVKDTVWEKLTYSFDVDDKFGKTASSANGEVTAFYSHDGSLLILDNDKGQSLIEGDSRMGQRIMVRPDLLLEYRDGEITAYAPKR